MKKTFFDRFIIGYFSLMFTFFLILLVYTTGLAKRSLISERENTLINEGHMIIKQAIEPYYEGKNSLTTLALDFEDLSDFTSTDLWYLDKTGNTVIYTNKLNASKIPDSIYDIVPTFTLNEELKMKNTFYGLYENDVLSVGIPILANTDSIDSTEVNGYLILHTSVTTLNKYPYEIFVACYIPVIVLILISCLFLAYLSSRVFKPISKISAAAKQYAAGNFAERINIHSNDELGELSTNLEYMADEINKLDEYRRQFIANISHDFRSPLTSIKGYVEAMLDGTIPPEKQEKYLNTVLSETKRLTKLTTGLLELNTFDRQGIMLKVEDFDIRKSINGTINTFEGTCNKKFIRLVLVDTAKQHIVTADKTKIQQVIYNLIDNAIKFSPHGSTITVKITQHQSKVFISVKDSGIGIDKEKQKKIWDRFYKTDSSRGKDKQGTGLGLSITKEIIKAHNENINVISTPGVGSEFIFTLTLSANQPLSYPSHSVSRDAKLPE